MPAFLFAVLALAAALLPGAAHAEETYLDDRSTPEALVRSLYNAINRHEYARAFSYFEPPPAADAEAYAKGFEETKRVALLTGTPSEEGAAGSVYYEIPVAIEATGAEGDSQVYAGCYTLRMANPQVQGDSFMPLHIEKGTLERSDAKLADALPSHCGDAPPPSRESMLLRQAGKMFAAQFGRICPTLGPQADPEAADPETFTLAYNLRNEAKGTPPHSARLIVFPCTKEVYNEMQVYYFASDDGVLRNLQFARPALDVRYENNKKDGKVESVEIAGFLSTNELANSTYDAKNMTITSLTKWRTQGDASSVGTWKFHNGEFVLVRYDVDASFNAKVDPQNILDYQTAP